MDYSGSEWLLKAFITHVSLFFFSKKKKKANGWVILTEFSKQFRVVFIRV